MCFIYSLVCRGPLLLVAMKLLDGDAAGLFTPKIIGIRLQCLK
jgi:putative intracellular protease/amidase